MDLFKRDNLPSMTSSLASSMTASMTPLIPVTSLGSMGSLPGGMQYKPMTSFGLVSSLAEPMLTNPVTHSHPVTIPQLPRPVPLQGSTGLPLTPAGYTNNHQHQQQLQNHHQQQLPHSSQESGHHHGGLQPSPTSHHIPIQASSPDLSDNLSTSSTSSGELSGGASGSGSSLPKRGKGKGVPYIPSYMDLSNGPEPCVVCGDAATGYHYRCMTCEGCKGFFRRTIQKNLQYHCKWNKNCVIDKTTRNQCQECRFIKCLNVGMATDLVLNEKQRTAKRKLIEENRVKRKEEQQKQRVRDPSGDPEVLSDQDRWLICEVVTAYEYTAGKVQNSLKGEYDGMSTDLQSQDPESWQGLAEAMTPSIIKVVEFAKSIPGFTELNVDDQILLLKSCCMEVMCLRAACRFDPEAETLTLYNGMKLHKSQIHKDGLAVLVEPIFDFAVGLAKLQLDKAELALLASILLMQSDRSGLKEPENVEKLQDAILGAFKRYVAENRPHQPVHWAKILMKVTDLRTISTRHAERVLCIRLDNSGEIPPLLLEVFNEGHAVSS